MKRIIFSILIIASAFVLHGQEQLNKLSSPTSPASSILGLQPTTILSPKSYQSFEAALYSNFLNNEGNINIPNDFALEFTPYWTKNHRLSLMDYLYPKNNIDLLIRNSSFSLASTQKFQIGDSSYTNAIGLGYRTTLYFGNQKDREKIENYKGVLNNKQAIVVEILKESYSLIARGKIKNKIDFIDSIKVALIESIYKKGRLKSKKEAEKLAIIICSKIDSLPEFNNEKQEEFIDAFIELLDEEIEYKSSFEVFESYIKERQGFSLDIAYASIINFPSNNFEYSIVPRQSFWLTPTYRFKDEYSFLKILGVIRYEWYNIDYYKKYFPATIVYTNNTDFGVALSCEFEKFTINFEAVGRNSNSEIPAGIDNEGYKLFRKDKKNDFQYIGTFSYNLSDQIVLTYSLGNRFDPIQNPKNTLVSLISLNFGFGTPTKSSIDIKK